MKHTKILLVAGVVTISASCKEFLDVNTNPNAPQDVSAYLYLPPMIHWMVTSPQFDGRFVGHYTQQWHSTSTNFSPAQSWGRMGYDAGSDNGAQQWRDVYWSLGQNLLDMNAKATAEHRWDLLGVGMLLKAWGWQAITDLHGEIIVSQAFDQTRTTFDYDTQQYAYQEIRRLLDSAIVLLQIDTGAVDAAYLGRGDRIYAGNRLKWLRFAHGMLALHLNHYSNKTGLDSVTRVMAEVDASFTSNADDALLAYPGTGNDDRNFLGPTRNNLTLYRQTQFIVGLMNGTQFGGTVDPRLTRMLAPAPDGQYRGLDVNQTGFSGLATAQQPGTFFGRYIFDDRARLPVITYAQLQFIKAEAALRINDQAAARTAYINGIRAHIAFVNDRNRDIATGAPAQITAAEESTFLASPAIVPAGNLTLSHVMSQKVIAQFGWGHNELWMDMRRHHYTDIDPADTVQVIRGFAPPSPRFSENADSLVQRIRPRFNSEYVWNRPGLDAIGGLASGYHVQTMWIIKP
jgi:hypothetical protein